MGAEENSTPQSHLLANTLQSSSPHLTKAMKVKFCEKILPEITVMIDSGATGNFCDIRFANEVGIQAIPKKRYEAVRAVDGTNLSSGPIVNHTEPVEIITQEGHREILQFNLIDAPQFQLILGLPWLTEHNPLIDWSARTITYNSDFCKESCFKEEKEHKEISQANYLSEGGMAICTIHTAEIPLEYAEYSDVFSEMEAENLPPHRSYDCKIELEPGANLPCSRIYALTEKENEHLKDYLQKYLANGFIRPSQSPVSSPLFFVPKREGDLRTCIDYRAINRITVKNRYPLPLISVLLDQVKGAQIYTKLDLRGAYHLIRVREGDEWKTAFKTRFGLYEYQVMPYGLCNAPAAFQHFINDVLCEFIDKCVIVYIDDILIYSNNQEEHPKQVRKVLQRLRENNLYVKLEKCAFNVESVSFLGFVLSPAGVTMDAQKVQAVTDWKSPSTVKEVQSFIGFANFYRRFISDFSKKIIPLTRLLKKGVPFEWSKEAEEAFVFLKRNFTTAPILLHADTSEPFFVETDASDLAIGGVLSQRHKRTGQLHPVAFRSRKLTTAEANYTITEKELLAIKDAFKEWRHYLMGAKHPVTVYTDHRNLTFLKSAKTLTPRQLRWSLYFADYDFVITYRPGTKNGKADALSRIDTELQKNVVKPQGIIPEEKIISATIGESLEEQIHREMSLEDMQNWANEDPTRKICGNLPFQGEALFLPNSTLQKKALYECHDGPLAGHKGISKTEDLIKRRFWWPQMSKDIQEYVKTCEICARGKSERSSPKGLLQPMPTPPHPWHTLTLDLIVDLPNHQGFNTILVCVDAFTKMAHFIPLKGIPSAKQLAQHFCEHIVKIHGIPRNIVSDRGTQFFSHFWKAFTKELQINSKYSTSYHPETDGQTERTNQELEQYLRLFLLDQEESWPDLLWAAEFAHNNARNVSTGYSPFYLNYGRHPNFSLVFQEDQVPAVTEVIKQLALVHKKAEENLTRAKEQYKFYADKKRKPGPLLEIGDKVWVN